MELLTFLVQTLGNLDITEYTTIDDTLPLLCPVGWKKTSRDEAAFQAFASAWHNDQISAQCVFKCLPRVSWSSPMKKFLVGDSTRYRSKSYFPLWTGDKQSHLSLHYPHQTGMPMFRQSFDCPQLEFHSIHRTISSSGKLFDLSPSGPQQSTKPWLKSLRHTTSKNKP